LHGDSKVRLDTEQSRKMHSRTGAGFKDGDFLEDCTGCSHEERFRFC
jgi:hypothetical protein